MELLINELEQIKIGSPVTFRSLTMFPLYNGRAGEPEYLTLDEALSTGNVHITEVSEGGSVPNLKLHNDGEKRVLLLDGEELIGAKQNRILNLSVLVEAHQSLIIPVSCVEAGRWDHQSEEFGTSSHAYYSGGRARKMEHVSASLRSTGSRNSDQGEVWADISEKSMRMEATSNTSAMSAIYEHHSKDVEEYVTALQFSEGQTGALFAINDMIVGFDQFDYPSTLQKLLPKLVRSNALDAIEIPLVADKIADRDKVSRFFDKLKGSKADSFPALGVGEDIRFSGGELTGAALVAEGRIIHISVFQIPSEGDESTNRPTTLSRASTRRQHAIYRTGN